MLVYVDKNTLFKVRSNSDAVVKTLAMSTEKLFKWFKDKTMKGNTDNIQLILSTADPNQT